MNIHLQDHKGISPRSYEIMATRSFELMDERDEYGAIIQPGKNVVVYHDVDDLLQKIEYYVNTECEREQIACEGYRAVREAMNLERSLKTILSID